jgi:ATP-dependent Clp protease protease subunit
MDVLINGELVLSGTVGRDIFDDGFTYTDVLLALTRMSGDITVRLNSGGGIATEGVAIYNALSQYKGRVTVNIEGLAASAASIIAMAGDEIIMGKGSLMMIHDPMVWASGNADDMEKVIEMLNTMGDAMAAIYADRTGLTPEEVRAQMREEIWMTADEAVAKGYASKVVENASSVFAAFDYRAYAHAPEAILAMSDERKWSNRLKAAAPKVTKQEQTEMNTKPNESAAPAPMTAEAAAKAEQDRATAIMDLCFKANMPQMAAAFVREGISVEQAGDRMKAEVARIDAIKAKVESARKMEPTLDASLVEVYAASGMSAEAAGDDLLKRIAAISAAAPTRSAHNASAPSDQAQASAAWDKVINNVNSQRGFSA